MSNLTGLSLRFGREMQIETQFSKDHMITRKPIPNQPAISKKSGTFEGGCGLGNMSPVRV